MRKRSSRIAGGVAGVALALACVGPAASATTDPSDPPATLAPTAAPSTTTVPTPEPTPEPSPSTDPSPSPDPSPTPDSSPTPDPVPTPEPTDPAATTDPTASPSPPATTAPQAAEPAQPAAAPVTDLGVHTSRTTTSMWAFPDVSLLPRGPLLSSVWSNPLIGRVTSSSGMRAHPVFGFFGLHAGTDIATACGTPVHAASNGVVVFVGNGFQGRTGNQVVIAHGDGIVTRYGHLLSGTTQVAVGDSVTAGQQIAQVGGNRALDPAGAGSSTGCHLHFEVNADDGATIVNPADYLLAAGVVLGVDAPYVAPDPAEAEPAVEFLTVVDIVPGVIPAYTSVLVERTVAP